MEFTHFDDNGNAYMVDVSGKEVTHRIAVAEGTIAVSREVMDAIKGRKVKKGDMLTVAQVAGIMGTKRTSELIPMCHPVSVEGIDLSLSLCEERLSVEIRAQLRCSGLARKSPPTNSPRRGTATGRSPRRLRGGTSESAPACAWRP